MRHRGTWLWTKQAYHKQPPALMSSAVVRVAVSSLAVAAALLLRVARPALPQPARPQPSPEVDTLWGVPLARAAAAGLGMEAVVDEEEAEQMHVCVEWPCAGVEELVSSSREEN